MIDKTLEAIGQLQSEFEKSYLDPRSFWVSILSAGISIAFLLICSLGVALGMIKVLFF